MAACQNFNQLYKKVRELGLPYEIKESEGSVIIKITADTNYSFRNHNKRTLNGSNTSNWRDPQHFHEQSIIRSPSFPTLNFFQTTPPPKSAPLTPPPPPVSPIPPPVSYSEASPSTALGKSNQSYQLNQLNPPTTSNP